MRHSNGRLDRGGERAGSAVRKFDQRRGGVAGRHVQRARLRQRGDPFHRADQIAETIQHMNAHAGHAAGAAFGGLHAPAIGRQIRQPVVAVIALDMHDGAEVRTFDDVVEHAHRRHQPEMMADADHDAGALDRIEHRHCICLAERERFFAVDMLAGGRHRFDLGAMLASAASPGSPPALGCRRSPPRTTCRWRGDARRRSRSPYRARASRHAQNGSARRSRAPLSPASCPTSRGR